MDTRDTVLWKMKSIVNQAKHLKERGLLGDKELRDLRIELKTLADVVGDLESTQLYWAVDAEVLQMMGVPA